MSAAVAATGAPQGRGLVPSETSQGKGPAPCFFRPFGLVDHQARIRRMRMALWGAATWFTNAMRGHRPLVAHMVTLTYAKADGWNAKHMSAAVELYRQWCRFRELPCRYTWVAEIQDGKGKRKFLADDTDEATGPRIGRGAVHYHLVAWLPVGVAMPHWDKVQRISTRKRCVIWAHGMTESDECRTGIGYLMKYASKGQNMDGFKFPRGLRIYGIGGLDEQGKQLRGWLALPEWCKRLHGVGEVVRAAGRLVVRATGEVLESPWVLERSDGGLWMRLARPMAERWFSGPYSSVSFT